MESSPFSKCQDTRGRGRLNERGSRLLVVLLDLYFFFDPVLGDNCFQFSLAICKAENRSVAGVCLREGAKIDGSVPNMGIDINSPLIPMV